MRRASGRRALQQQEREIHGARAHTPQPHTPHGANKLLLPRPAAVLVVTAADVTATRPEHAVAIPSRSRWMHACMDGAAQVRY